MLRGQNVDADAVKVVEAELTKTFDKIENSNYIGIMRLSADGRDNNFMFMFDGALCDKTGQPKLKYDLAYNSGQFINVKREYEGSCSTPVNIEVTGKVNYQGEQKSVVTVTFHGGYAGFTDMAIATSGFAVVPQTFGRWGSGVKYTVPAPYVIHNDTMYFFTKENSSFKLN